MTPTHAQQVPLPKTDVKVPGPVPGAPLSKEYVAAIGRLAYIWGWPLANMQNRHKMFSLAPEPGLMGGLLPVAPIGQATMLSDYIKPEQRFVTSPNQDVVYGAGFLSLDEEHKRHKSHYRGATVRGASAGSSRAPYVQQQFMKNTLFIGLALSLAFIFLTFQTAPAQSGKVR